MHEEICAQQPPPPPTPPAYIHHGRWKLFSLLYIVGRGRFMSRFINARSPVLPISYAGGRLIPSHWSVSASDEGIFCARKLCGSAPMTFWTRALFNYQISFDGARTGPNWLLLPNGKGGEGRGWHLILVVPLFYHQILFRKVYKTINS